MNQKADTDDMRSEYDFSGGVRGKHHTAYREDANVVLLEPEVVKKQEILEMNNVVDTIPGAKRIVHDILRARREGRLPERFTAAQAKEACPRWASNISNFLSKHRCGNPRGETERFMRNDDGTWSLVGECRGRTGQ